jgi:hypothetical protein
MTSTTIRINQKNAAQSRPIMAEFSPVVVLDRLLVNDGMALRSLQRLPEALRRTLAACRDCYHLATFVKAAGRANPMRDERSGTLGAKA